MAANVVVGADADPMPKAVAPAFAACDVAAWLAEVVDGQRAVFVADDFDWVCHCGFPLAVVAGPKPRRVGVTQGAACRAAS